MRHIGRTHGVSVAWLSERFAEDNFQLDYCDTADQVADVYTKAFSDPIKWQHAHELAGVMDPGQIKRIIVEHRERHERMKEDASKGLGGSSGAAKTGEAPASRADAAPCSTRGVGPLIDEHGSFTARFDEDTHVVPN